MLGLAYIYFDIVCLAVLSDDHTGVYFFTRTDEKSTTFLSIEQTVSNRFSGFEGDQGALFTILDVALVWSISVEQCVHDTISLGVSHEFATVSDQTTGRDRKFQTGISTAAGIHVAKFTFSLT